MWVNDSCCCCTMTSQRGTLQDQSVQVTPLCPLCAHLCQQQLEDILTPDVSLSSKNRYSSCAEQQRQMKRMNKLLIQLGLVLTAVLLGGLSG